MDWRTDAQTFEEDDARFIYTSTGGFYRCWQLVVCMDVHLCGAFLALGGWSYRFAAVRPFVADEVCPLLSDCLPLAGMSCTEHHREFSISSDVRSFVLVCSLPAFL